VQSLELRLINFSEDPNMFNRPLTQIQRWPQPRSSGDRGSGTETSAEKGQSPVVNASPQENDLPSRTQQQGRRNSSSKDRSGLKVLRLPLEVRSETRMETSLGVPKRDIPVWDKYDKVYEVDLMGTVTVAERRPPSSGLVMERQVSTIELDRKAKLFRQLRGQYFLTCFEMFGSRPLADLVFEYMDLSLLQILGAPLFPAEKHIVAIAAQVLQNSSV
jgi:hypothetical protein